MLAPMSELVDERFRDVIEAMRQMLGFAAAVLARLDMDRGGLVLSFAIGDRGHFLQQAADVLGFDPTGAAFPLWAEQSLFVRCYRGGRIVSTTSIQDLFTGALPPDTFEPFEEIIGPRLFVCVPIPGPSGAILAVVLLERPRLDALTADERDQLLLYAARLGQLLEADRLGAPPVDSSGQSPFTRWLSVTLLDRGLRTVWTAGVGPPTSSIITVLGGELKPGRFEVTLKDGVALRINVYMVDPGGEVAWLVLCENLAQRDREVRELREQLRLRLARVHESVVSVDRDLRVTGCNEATRDILGYEPAELIGRSIRSALPGGKVTRAHHRLVSDLLNRGHVERQLQLVRKDGSKFPGDLSILLLADDDEEPSGAIATVRDLSEQKRQAAERLRLRKRVLRSERLAALGEMAARIAHEVRNPLAAIGAAALSIEEDDGGGDLATLQARAIGEEVRRLDAILTDLLQFARPKPVTRTPVDLVELVRDTLDVVGSDPQAEAVELELENEAVETCFVTGDPNGLRQVLMNVLRNAVEASGAGGRVSCRLTNKAGKVELLVSNTGPILSRTTRKRAFEPFFSTKSRGTGLGLPISRQIIEEHGGELALSARRGGGATVSVALEVSDDAK